jgi:hypothetical protein
MGHNRLGRLPRTRRWREVVDLLDAPSISVDAVASAVVEAADRRFREIANEPALNYAFWILTRVTWAARSDSFLRDLAWLGVRESPDASALGLISGAVQHVRSELSRFPDQNDFTEIATLAVSRALTETVGREGPDLFSSTADDARRAFRAYSTAARFGELARIFFADVMARSLRAFVDREVSNHTHPGKAIKTTGDGAAFLEALDLHARQGARIVEEFTGGWYSLHNWETSGDISLDESSRFVAQAMRKLRAELKQGADDK